MKTLLLIMLITILLIGCTKISEDDYNSTANIEGTVSLYTARDNLAGVIVTLDTGETTLTNAEGKYYFDEINPATHEVVIEEAGYYKTWANVLAKAGQTAILDFEMVADTVALDVTFNLDEVDFEIELEEIELQISNFGAPVPVAWEIQCPADWVVAIPDSGSIYPNSTTKIQLMAIRDSLPLGEYADTLTVYYLSQEYKISVNLEKADALIINPTDLNFGPAFNTLPVTFWNPTGGAYTWEIEEDIDWLSFTGLSGNGDSLIYAQVDRTGMIEGQSYTGEINVTSSIINKTIPVSCIGGNDSILTVYDIQYTTEAGADSTYPSLYYGSRVSVQGIVSAKQGDRFYLTDPEGGAWHGVYVFDYNFPVEIGDNVIFIATVDEYYGMTELKTLASFHKLSSDNALPLPKDVTTNDFNSNEAYEGVLVAVNIVTVTDEQDSYGQWYVDDGSGKCQIDDVIFYLDDEGITITAGNTFQRIIGIGDYSYDEYGILPRSPDDLIGQAKK